MVAEQQLSFGWDEPAPGLRFRVEGPTAPFVRLGTCSWKYDSWRGLVYSAERVYRPDEYLEAYGARLDTVEVDQWFWSLFPGSDTPRLPDPAAVARYTADVPETFRFTVKAPNALTLAHRPGRGREGEAREPNPHFLSPELAREFLERLAPMGPRLGPVMLQFGYLNRGAMSSAAEFILRLDRFFDALPAGPTYAVEIRNPNYLTGDWFEFLRRRAVGHVHCDGYYMPAPADVAAGHNTLTAPFSVVRLLGCDREGIEQETGNRWDTLVDPRDRELERTVALLRENVARRAVTYVNVNNHYEGSAPRTIDRLVRLLESPDEPAAPPGAPA